MKHELSTLALLAGLLTPSLASANPEPTAYDTRSIGMGLTGTSWLERPAALAMNPANLEGIDKLGFTFNFTNLLVNQTAPVQGAGTSLSSGIGYGPLPSGFLAGRIAPRVVFAGGIYIETGYGSSFDNVTCLDGVAVNEEGNVLPNGDCNDNMPQSLDVTFFVGEFATGFSFKAHEKFWLGVALRLPFSKQVADLYQNIGAALPAGIPQYGRVKNDLGGVGHPTFRFGFQIKAHEKLDIGLMYRMAGKIKMTGTTETSLLPDLVLSSEADWFIPHAFAIGISSQINSKTLLAFDFRMQFHGADKSGNKNQTVTAQLPVAGAEPIVTIVPFGWQNTWSVKLAAEHRFVDLFAIRGGANIARSATTDIWAQYFTPPPGLSGNVSLGFGFYWDDRNDPSIKDKYMLDLAGAFAFTTGTLGDPPSEEQQIPGTDPSDPNSFVQVCSTDQVVRTGCAGDYKVFTYWASLSFTLQY